MLCLTIPTKNNIMKRKTKTKQVLNVNMKKEMVEAQNGLTPFPNFHITTKPNPAPRFLNVNNG